MTGKASHIRRGAQADVMSVVLAIIIFAYLGFARPHALASHAPAMYALTMALMLALLGAAYAAPRVCTPASFW
jgi:hypothetical protein